ncbi:hypothetical protein [Lysinibacillus sp. FSL K6-3209]
MLEADALLGELSEEEADLVVDLLEAEALEELNEILLDIEWELFLSEEE